MDILDHQSGHRTRISYATDQAISKIEVFDTSEHLLTVKYFDSPFYQERRFSSASDSEELLYRWSPHPNELHFEQRSLTNGVSRLPPFTLELKGATIDSHSTDVCVPHAASVDALERELEAYSNILRKDGLGHLDLNIEVVPLNCQSYPGAVSQLRADFEHALVKGLSCLAEKGPTFRDDVASMLGMLAPHKGKPILLKCDPDLGKNWGLVGTVEGWASSPSDPKFPTIIVNPTKINRNPVSDSVDRRSEVKLAYQRESEYFHEAMHLLGYVHGQGFDLAYVATACCVPDEGDEDLALKRKTGLMLGRLLAAVLKGDSSRVAIEWSSFLTIRAAACRAFLRNEKKDIQILGEISQDKLLEISDHVPAALIKAWPDICER
ncbi:hypothetical protein WDW37_20410 [Bdellovibrionota bacterium FG-1]